MTKARMTANPVPTTPKTSPAIGVFWYCLGCFCRQRRVRIRASAQISVPTMMMTIETHIASPSRRPQVPVARVSVAPRRWAPNVDTTVCQGLSVGAQEGVSDGARGRRARGRCACRFRVDAAVDRRRWGPGRPGSAGSRTSCAPEAPRRPSRPAPSRRSGGTDAPTARGPRRSRPGAGCRCVVWTAWRRPRSRSGMRAVDDRGHGRRVEVGRRGPRVDPFEEQGLGGVEGADAGEVALVEQGGADRGRAGVDPPDGFGRASQSGPSTSGPR